jgi:pimeloyl-ACP methyl ester carboxylesterase
LSESTTTGPRSAEPDAATEDATIRPFQVEVSEAELVELRRRLAATRWPSRELVTDRSRGVQLATVQELARYRATGYGLSAQPTEVGWDPDRAAAAALATFRASGFGYFLGQATRPQGLGGPVLTYFNEADKGGHFAAWEQPDLFTTEIRAAFRSLR